MSTINNKFIDWQECFQKTPLAQEVVINLAGRSQEIWQRTFDLLRQESPEYRNAIDDEFTAESRSHCGELLETIVAIAAGRLESADPFSFVRKHAEWRARHQIPLVASLHAYRLAHKTYWGLTRESLVGYYKQEQALHALEILSDFWIELFEIVGATLEEAHATEEARVVAQNTHTYVKLIDDLLNGITPSSLESRQLLTLCGIRPGTKMTVAILRLFPASNDKHIDVEITLRSLVRLLHQVLPSSVFGKLVSLRKGEIVAIVSSDCDGAERLIKHLNSHKFGQILGHSISVGVGLDKTEIRHLPEAYTEACLALDLTNPTRTMLHFANIELNEFIINRVDRIALKLIPIWIRETYTNEPENVLIRTLRMFANCSLNVKETARQLDVHTNTVYFRLNQIKKHTGVDVRTFVGISLLITALKLLDYNSSIQINHRLA